MRNLSAGLDDDGEHDERCSGTGDAEQPGLHPFYLHLLATGKGGVRPDVRYIGIREGGLESHRPRRLTARIGASER